MRASKPPKKIRVKHLFVYPVKGCQPVSLQSAILTQQGTLSHDREFCVIDLDGTRYPAKKSISMRELPGLASIRVELTKNDTELVLSAVSSGDSPSSPPSSFTLPMVAPAAPAATEIQIECSGRSTTSAGSWHLGCLRSIDRGDLVSAWLSAHLNSVEVDPSKKSKAPSVYRLVQSTAARSMAKYAGPKQVPFSEDVDAQAKGVASPFKMQKVNVRDNDKVRFADFAGLNVSNLASFEDLKDKIREMTPAVDDGEIQSYDIRSFRTNIVVENAHPWDEENWKEFSVGGASLRLLKGCPRCSVPARAFETGKFHFGAPKRLRPQDALRKYWPEKCVDNEWGTEWQGTMFSIHAGVNWEKSNGGWQGGGGGGVLLRVGDEVSVVERTDDGAALRMVLKDIALFLFAFAAVYALAMFAVYGGYDPTGGFRETLFKPSSEL
jgi:uncharacterized protein YcbX